MRVFLIWLYCCCPLIAAEDQCLLGFGLTEGAIGFEKTFQAAQGLGIDFVEIPVQWDEIEQSKEQYGNQYLDIANIYFPAQKTRLVLSLNPIDTTTLRLPKDLQRLAFDDPRVIDRFLKFIDYVVSRCPNAEIAAIAVGNEVDAYLGNDPKAWAAYTQFFKLAKIKLKKLYPDTLIGVKITSKALLKKEKQMRGLLKESDALMPTFYPLNDDFTVQNPELAIQSFDALFQLLPEKPVCLLEAGYPSSKLCQSSEQQQAKFMKLLIEAWGEQRKRMPLLNIVWMHDLSVDELRQMQMYYGVRSKVFAGFIGSLGIRHNNGEEKPAFQQLKTSLEAFEKSLKLAE